MDNDNNFTEYTSTATTELFQPKPTDFDTFLPWACKQYSIDVDVFITRAVQETYVSIGFLRKKSITKPIKKQTLIPTITGSEGDIYSLSLDKAVIRNENIIMMETYYNSNENLVQLKLLKNKAIPRKIMQIIALTLPYQKHLTSITINSGLRMDSLYEISKFLPNSYITELCLDSTFISEANYHILLTDNKIKHLSLAKCMINDAVLKTIADRLKYPYPASKVLTALNLSSNRITDVGAKYLADMLRTNRQLCYLNLAGNMIADEGGMSILDTLHEFPLHAQELLESRTRYVAYLKQKIDLINTLNKELESETFNKNPNKKKPLKKGKPESQSLDYFPSQKRLIDNDEARIIQGKAECLAVSRMGLSNEPFSPNNTQLQDGVVHCFGNNTLCYLNLAYNNLTYNSVKKLHEVLSRQNSLHRTPRGLIKVVIEGNLMPVACKEYGQINQFLELVSDGLGSIRKQSSAARKRSILTKPLGKTT